MLRLAATLLLCCLSAAAMEQPAAGPASAIGAAAHGCLQGASALPQSGPGWQVLRPDHNRFWGMPALVAVIEEQAARIRQFGQLLIGDMSLPRGGRMPSGHASHQSGLDADILFRLTDHALTDAERDDPDLTGVLSKEGRVLAERWSNPQLAMLKDFAEDARVERIFVNPAIKRHLCRTVSGDRGWLHRIRPWWGHAAHFHVRLACPAGSAQCEAGPAIPEGDGCGADLDWWFTREAAAPAAPSAPSVKIPSRYSPQAPAACKAILPSE
jgi:penicillin-insensitive murein endopeptidase